MHRRLTRLTGALACAGLVAGTAAFTGTASSSAAEDPSSLLNLVAPEKVTARSYDGWVYTDLGLRLTAPTEPIEIRAHRPGYDEDVQRYDEPIESEWYNAPGGPRQLPDGSMSTFAGLDDFVRVEIRRVGEERVLKSWSQTVCLNGWSQRIDPDAPATSPYPYGCPHNPYTVGSVMGLQGGYTTSLMNEWGGQQFRLRPGTYDLTASITDSYAEFFGLSDLAVSDQTLLVVREVSRRTARASAEPASTEPESAIATPTAAEPASADPCGPDDPKPDLRSLPAWNIGLNGKGTVLRFAANVWNGGNTPLVVDGFRAAEEDHMDAYQYFFDQNDQQVCYEPAGEMHWHADNHRHWHFEDFAQYALVDAKGDGGHEVVSTKQSFCLANTDAVDYTVPGADWHPENTDLGTACGGRDALSVRQVLSAGSGDTYFQYRAGQAFSVKGVPDGVYWIAVRANKDGHLTESNVNNNVSYRRVRLGTTRQGERFVRVPPRGIVDEHGGFGGF